MKNLHYFSKSRLLFTLIALFMGISSSWAQKSLPYSYGFENNDLAAEGWTMVDCTTGYSSTKIATDAKMNGSYGFMFWYNTTPPQYLISPELATSTKTIDVSFWYKNGATYTETFNVGYSTTDSDKESFTWLDEDITAPTSWTQFSQTFPAGVKYIAIKYTANNQYRLYIDDFYIEYTPTCFKPTDLTASETTYNSVKLSWTAGSTEQDAWQVAYSSTSDFNPDDVTPVDATTNPFILTGLNPETTYYAYVRGNCGANDKSTWSNMVSFTTPEKYGKPTALACTTTTATTASLTWTAGGTENAWEIAYSTTSNFNPEDATIESVNTNSATLSSLTAATTYYAKVRASIGDEYSNWSSEISFTTGYASPYNQPFASSSIPSGWNQYSGLLADVLNGAALTSGSGWKFGTSNGVFDFHTNSNLYGTSCKYWLVSPNVEVGSNDQLTFNLALTAYSGTTQAAATSGTDDKFAVLVSIDNGATWTQLALWDNAGSARVLNNIATTGEEIALSLSDYKNKGVKIAFYVESTVSNADNNLHIDDVSIDVTPSCIKPTELAVSNVAAHSATISWTSDATAWNIQYKKASDSDWTLVENISTNPYTLSSLTSETAYQVQVQTNCGGSDVSAWTDAASFTTLASCITPTDFAVSGLTLNSATLTWTDATEQSKWEVSYSTTNGDPNAGTIVPVTEKTYTITGLTAGTTYYACVRAVNSDTDKSAWSTEISFTPGVLTVNDGTTQNYYIPLYGDYASVATGTQSQFIIPAESLGNIAGNQIDKIVFYCTTTSKSWGNASFEVYVKEVENTTFTSKTPSWDGMTKVYSGQLSVANGLMTIQFNEPFEYTNKNLMIGIKQTVKGKDSGAYWYGITTTQNTAIDGKNGQYCTFLPKTDIYYSAIEMAPKMVVSETEFKYGLVAQNSEQTKTFTIENKGKAPLEGITVTSSNTAFTVTEVNNQSIAVNGEAITVTVTFDTTTPGDYDGTITVSATGQDDATIAVSGTVRNPNKVYLDFADGQIPDGWTSVAIGSYASQYGSAWTASEGYVSQSGSSSSYAWAFTSPKLNFTNGELIAFETAKYGSSTWNSPSITIEYTTDETGATGWTAIGSAFTDDTYGNWTSRSVKIPVEGVKRIRFNGWYVHLRNIYGGELLSGARFAINTDGTTQDFGFVEPNATAEKTYTITNAGNSDLYLSLDASEGFSIEGGNALLFTSNKGWNSVYVHAWNEEGNLTTWPGNPATYVGKNGNNEDQYAFIVPEGATGIVIDNGGTEQTQDIKNFDVTGYYLKGDLYDGNKYWAESWGTAPSALKVAAGESANITVKISTETPGLKSGNVILNANALNVQSFTIPVTGYVVDESKFYETFANNQLPEGWSDNTGWTFADGKAVSDTDTQMTLPALTVAEGEKMAISIEATGSNPELFYYISTDGGTNWTKSSNIGSTATTTAYSVVYIDGLAAGNYKLKLQGYHVQIDALNGFTLNANAPALAVSPTTAADFGKVTETPEAKTYTVTNTGTGKLTVNIASDSEDFTVNPAKIEDIAAGESSTFTIAFNYTEGNYGDKSATITVTPTYDETAAVTITATATAKNPNVWEEDFEDGSMPTTWNNEGGWTVSQPTASGSNGTYMATISSYNNPKKLTTPRLEAKANETLQFYIGMQYDDEPLTIEYSNDDKATWNVIENGVASYTASGDITFTAPTDGYYYIRFTGTYAMLDNFIGFKLAMKEHDAEITTTNIPATGTQYAEYTATVTVKELAGKSEELTAKFFIGDTQYGEDVVETVEANGTKTFTVTFTPVEAFSGNAYFTVTNDKISLESEKKAIEIVAAPVFDETEELTYLAEKTESSLVVKYTPKNGWNTICMPFALTDDILTNIFGEDWKAYEFKSYENDLLGFDIASTFYAGYPYIIYVAEAAEHVDGVILNNVNITKTTAQNDSHGNATFQGTFAPIAAPGMEGKWGVTSEAKIAKGTDEASIKGFRAYFELPDGANARLSFFDDATGITTIIGADELNDDKAYNLSGQRVQNPKKGLYIINGKKVVIK